MPLEASSLIGSLGGIGAIAREVFGGDGAPNTPRPTTRSTPSVSNQTQQQPNPFVIRPEGGQT